MVKKQSSAACAEALDLAWEERALKHSTPHHLQVAASIIAAHKLSVPLVRSVKVEPPPVADYKPAGYHYVFCTHNVPYWRPCGGCKRTKGDAIRHMASSRITAP